MNKKKAFITGVTGQDGCYLSKFLLSKGYDVLGIVRKDKAFNTFGLNYLGISKKIELVPCDLSNFEEIFHILRGYLPDEVYNLCAESSVGNSFLRPHETLSFNINSNLNLLESIRILSKIKLIKFYQASSSEMYGKVPSLPILEDSVIHPLSPYAVSKATNHHVAINYRESYGLFTACGILFNHESFLRNESFFIKKIIKESIRIFKGKKDLLKVGNLNVKRDFGFAPKYVEAMWLILQHEKPQDFIICSGKSISLNEIVNWIFNFFDLPDNRLQIDKSLFRPNELLEIYGDCTKAKTSLGWNYENDFFDILSLLIKEELENFNE